MKLAVFSTKPYDRKYLTKAAPSSVDLTFHDVPLGPDTAPLLHPGEADAICVFVNDQLPAPVLETLQAAGVRAILLRCAGFNNVDLPAAERLGLSVANVPSYSPEAVAEYGVALLQTLNRKTHRAHARVREGNFSLDGLLGRTLHGKTVGLVGTGRIGIAFARIMKGFGCRLLAYDPYPAKAFEEEEIGGRYTTLEDLLPQCDVVSLHCPLTEHTRHIINAKTLSLMPPHALLINTSRGGLIDTRAVINALKSRALAGLALDVYEREAAVFYDDHSGDIIEDDDLMRLTTFPNVLLSGHQAFFTHEALREISECTVRNLADVEAGRPCRNALVTPKHVASAAPPAAAGVATDGTLPVRTV